MSKVTSKNQSGKKPEENKTVSRGTKKAVSRETKKLKIRLKRSRLLFVRVHGILFYIRTALHIWIYFITSLVIIRRE